MKLKLLALAVSGVILAGCNNDTNIKPTVTVQAFDPAIYNMNADASCDDGTTESTKTNIAGNAPFYKSTVINSPETCSFTFTGIDTTTSVSGSIDVSNGKLMGSDVVYKIPKGLAAEGAAITASPLTTLIAAELEATGTEYSESTAQAVLADLGLSSVLNSGVSVNELLLNTETVVADLQTQDPDNYSLLSATTTVLSDVLKEDTGASVEDIATTAEAFTVEVLDSAPNYPTSTTGELVVVELDPTEIADVVDNVENNQPPAVPDQDDKLEPAKPVDPAKPPTGGTGGTGGGGGGEG